MSEISIEYRVSHDSSHRDFFWKDSVELSKTLQRAGFGAEPFAAYIAWCHYSSSRNASWMLLLDENDVVENCSENAVKIQKRLNEGNYEEIESSFNV